MMNYRYLTSLLTCAVGISPQWSFSAETTRAMQLQLESSINGQAWSPADLSSVQALPDGRLWFPFVDHQVNYRLRTTMGKTGEEIALSGRGDSDGDGFFLSLSQSGDLETWQPVDGNDLFESGGCLTVPDSGSKGFWKIDFEESVPDPLPLPPLQVISDPSVTFEEERGAGAMPPEQGLAGYFGEFISNPPEPVPFPGPHAFNKYIFEERVHQTFEGDVKGYAVVIANDEGFQGKVSGGWARDPNDGGRRMTTYRAGNVGSVAKLYSGVALMQLLEAMGPDIDTALDQAIGPFLPQRWLDDDNPLQVSNAHEAITFRQLLNHTAGLADLGSGSRPANLVDNPSYFNFTQPLGAPVYSNENSRIQTYLIPRLAYPFAMQVVEATYENADFDEYLDEVMEAYGLKFEEYMRDVFFPQVAGTCAPSADPANAYNGNNALMYVDINDTTGLQWSQKELSGFSRAQGGYWSTAQELARFMQSIRYTNDLISPAASQQLLNTPGWLINNSSVNNADFNAEFASTNRWRYKPGLHPSGGHVGIGNAMNLPYDWVCSLVVNSESLRTGPNESTNANSARDIVAGFYDATRDEPVTISREAMRVNTFDETAAYLRERHMEVLWLDLYDIAGEVFVNATFGKAPEPVAGKIAMNGQEYQAFYDKWVKLKGFAIQQVESYLDNGKIRYAAIITEENRPEQRAYHGWSYDDHVAKANEWKDQGFVPINVSVVTLNGQRRYTALYEHRAVQFSMQTRMDANEYNTQFHAKAKDGFNVVSLNAYLYQGRRYYAAIWHKLNSGGLGIHEANRDAYRAADATYLNDGRTPVIITGVDSTEQSAATNERHRFGAIWR
ncbi:serine hydrolase [Akkermansiaceae bacterium]|nr:serine hydrolase [Akkermansiaceae bacterium]